MRFSVIIPVYDRQATIRRALASAQAAIAGRADCEIIIVDDASVDSSIALVENSASDDIRTERLRVLRHQKNRGVNAARNTGVRAANGEWILFLDSDDEFAVHSDAIWQILTTMPEKSGLVFFRSIQSDGVLSGPSQDAPYWLGLPDIVRHSLPGECLAVVTRDLMRRFPFDEDLRGFELLTWSTIVAHIGRTWVVPAVARRYYIDDQVTRLSSRRGRFFRACNLRRGWFRYTSRFWRWQGVHGVLAALIRIVYYALLCPFAWGTRALIKTRPTLSTVAK